MLESSLLETPSPNFEPSNPMAELALPETPEAPEEAMDTGSPAAGGGIKEAKVEETEVVITGASVVTKPEPVSPVEELEEMDEEELAIIKVLPGAKTTAPEVVKPTAVKAEATEVVKPVVKSAGKEEAVEASAAAEGTQSPSALSLPIPVLGSPSRKPDPVAATASPIAVVVGSPRKAFSSLAGPPSRSSTPPTTGTATPPPGSATPPPGSETPTADSVTPPPSETSSVCSQDDSVMVPLMSPPTPADAGPSSPKPTTTEPYLMKGVQSIRVLSQVKRDFC